MDQQSVGGEASSAEKGRPTRNFRRSYKACKLCRRKKIRCITDGPGKSCLRCKRELRECVFPLERSHQLDDANQEIRIPFEPIASTSTGADVHKLENAQASNPPQGVGSFAQSSIASVEGDGWAAIDSDPFLSQDKGTTHTQPPFNTSSLGSVGVGPSGDSGRETNVAGDLNGTLMRTLVSNGNDALKLLFHAALEQKNADSPRNPPSVSRYQQTVIDISTPENKSSVSTDPVEYSVVSPKTLRVWDAFRFTKMGWFSSEEAVAYMDLFFKNLAPLSLVSKSFDPSHDAHFKLITQEPLLCCVILLISSRYHVLPGSGGIARSTLIHQRLWEHCQHLIMRIIFGQEKRSKAKTRTKGSIEALLLMVEWHSRAIYFPPGADGWDSSLLLTDDDPRDDQFGNRADTTDEINVKWFREIVTPAKTSDRMSWMLLGCAQSLALELGLCEISGTSGPTTSQAPEWQSQKARLSELLYILIEQHSGRLGCPSMLPGGLSRMPTEPSRSREDSGIITAWLDLTNLLRTINDVLFPSPVGTKDLLKNGRYITIIKHFRQQLQSWKAAYLDPGNLPSHYQEELAIEYSHIRAFMNSLGIQAVVDRVLGNADPSTTDPEIFNLSINPSDYEFIKEVAEGSCQTLEAVNRLFEAGTLRFCPVRVFLRVITASILLLKALSLGTRVSELQASLAVLEKSIQALKASTLDEMHLAVRYGSLLESHLSKFKQGMVPSTIPRSISSFHPFGNWDTGDSGTLHSDSIDNFSFSASDWLALPLDRSMAPFGLWGNSSDVPDLEDRSWDVLWSLPSV